MKRAAGLVLAVILPLWLSAQDSPPAGILLLHSPPHAVLNDRPYRIDFIVEMDTIPVESVSLFYMTNTGLTFRELDMPGAYNRHYAVLPSAELQGDSLTYFFLVTTDGFGLWGYPSTGKGGIAPIVRALVPPTQGYFEREFRGRP